MSDWKHIEKLVAGEALANRLLLTLARADDEIHAEARLDESAEIVKSLKGKVQSIREALTSIEGHIGNRIVQGSLFDRERELKEELEPAETG